MGSLAGVLLLRRLRCRDRDCVRYRFRQGQCCDNIGAPLDFLDVDGFRYICISYDDLGSDLDFCPGRRVVKAWHLAVLDGSGFMDSTHPGSMAS